MRGVNRRLFALNGDMEHLSVADIYDGIYRRLSHTTLFQAILTDVMGSDCVRNAEHFSFIGRSELDDVVAALCRSQSLRALDLGCGLGGLTVELARRCEGRWTGIDNSRVAIEEARRRAARNVSFAVATIEAMPFADNSFNCIVAIDSVQHTSPYSVCARELSRVLETGGSFVFTNWMRLLPLEQLVTADPLLSELVDNGFRIDATQETDPFLTTQFGVYVALYEHRREVEDALGRDFLELMCREAAHLVGNRGSVGRNLTIAIYDGH